MSGFNLFVYGTLRGDNARGGDGRSGDGRSGRLDGCTRIGDGQVAGTLYDIGGRYPALVPYGTDVIRGEIWRCPAETLQSLDAYEDTQSGLFRRIGAEVQTEDGTVACWLYAAGPALSRELTPAQRVKGGTWKPPAT